MMDVRNLYHAVIESSDDAIIAKDTDGIVQFWNAAAERLFGYAEDEIVGRSIRVLLPEELQEEEDAILGRIRAGERIGQFFTRRRHKSGRLIDVLVTVSPMRDANGTIVGASKIARDAGSLLADQQRLRDSERRFRMMADNIAPLAWIAGPDGAIDWYNKRWHDYTGTTPEEMEATNWHAFHHPDHLERVTTHFTQAIEQGVEWEDTFPLRRHDGAWRWFLSRAKPITNGSITNGSDKPAYWFGTNTDITATREQAEQIRLLLMEVNHRAKNMLGTVQALARRSASDQPAFLKRFEDRIRSLAVNQDILVKREWKQVPVRELAEAQLDFVDQAPGEFTLLGADLLLIPRAAETIGMALHELATNALKYGALSVPGGHVDIGWAVGGGAPEGDEAGTGKSEGKREGEGIQERGHVVQADDARASASRESGSRFTMWWREQGGPEVTKSGHKGFGSRLIDDVPRLNLGAEVELDYHRDGVSWQMRCPLHAVSRPAGILV